MAFPLFLGYAALSLVWSPGLVKASQELVATCAAGTNQQVPTEMFALASIGTVNIVCPANNTLDPEGVANAQTNAEIYATSGATTKVQLRTHLPGSLYVKKDTKNQLTVVQLPDKEVSVFFRCHNNNAAVCWIGVAVAAQPPLGPQGCAIGGSTIKFSLTAPNQTALFMCAENKSVLPATEGKVYSADCKSEVNLATEIPGAKLTRATGGVMSSFAVTTLPASGKTLCVVCGTKPDEEATALCNVHLIVSSSAAGGSTGLMARVALALGIALAGATLYHDI